MGTLAAIVTVFDRRMGALLWVLAILVGIARVLSAVHHPIDILASFGIAIAATTAVYTYLITRQRIPPVVLKEKKSRINASNIEQGVQ